MSNRNIRRSSTGRKRNSFSEDKFDDKRSKRDEVVYGPEEITKWCDMEEYTFDDDLDKPHRESSKPKKDIIDGGRTQNYTNRGGNWRQHRSNNSAQNGHRGQFDRSDYHVDHKPRESNFQPHVDHHQEERNNRSHQYGHKGFTSNFDNDYSHSYDSSREYFGRGSSSLREESHKDGSRHSGKRPYRDQPYRGRPSRDEGRVHRERDTQYSKYDNHYSHNQERNRDTGYRSQTPIQDRNHKHNEEQFIYKDNPQTSWGNHPEVSHTNNWKSTMKEDCGSTKARSESRDIHCKLETPQPAVTAENVTLNGVVGTMLHKLASCSLKNKDDANMALTIINMFLKPLEEFSHKHGDEKSVNYIKAAEMNLKLLKDQSLFMNKPAVDNYESGHRNSWHENRKHSRNHKPYDRHVY